MMLFSSQKGASMENRCVYMWINDNTHKPFYVGCGTLKRAFGQAQQRSKAFHNILRNNKCHCVIIRNNLSVNEAAELERKVIKKLREQDIELVNATNGGEIGHIGIWTHEMRKEYSERLTGKNNPNYGKTWTDEMKKQLSTTRIEKGIAKGSRNPRATPVMCVETGEIFKCKRDAGKFLGVSDANSSIWFCIKNPKRVAGKGKYHFVGQDMFDKLNTEDKRKEWLENIAS